MKFFWRFLFQDAYKKCLNFLVNWAIVGQFGPFSTTETDKSYFAPSAIFIKPDEITDEELIVYKQLV